MVESEGSGSGGGGGGRLNCGVGFRVSISIGGKNVIKSIKYNNFLSIPNCYLHP